MTWITVYIQSLYRPVKGRLSQKQRFNSILMIIILHTAPRTFKDDYQRRKKLGGRLTV